MVPSNPIAALPTIRAAGQLSAWAVAAGDAAGHERASRAFPTWLQRGQVTMRQVIAALGSLTRWAVRRPLVGDDGLELEAADAPHASWAALAGDRPTSRSPQRAQSLALTVSTLTAAPPARGRAQRVA